jgi:alkaline phosphatase D
MVNVNRFAAGALAFWLVLSIGAMPAAAQSAPSGNQPLTRIAFGSCADEEKPQPIWDAVLAYQPQLFLFAGDNVYGDVRGGRNLPEADLLDGLRESYAAALRVPGFMRIKSEIPHLATWDDHDYGKNDAGEDFAGRVEAQRMFLDFWNVPPEDPRRRRQGVYYAQTFGPAGMRVQVILLDTRYHRSPLKPTDQRGAPGKERYLPDETLGRSMLGEEQWAWLAEQLREPAELRLIVSSVQVVADGHGWERWGNFPSERQRLYNLVRETRARGVVFLSGDRHIGAIYRQDGSDVPYPLLDVTSSGLNQAFAENREIGPNRIGDVHGAVNFGTIDIDWAGGTVSLALRGETGTIVRQLHVRLEELSHSEK